jgi:hypothetical protein
MILNPNDGFGCGRSVFWEYKALEFAKELHEDCGHINIDNLIVKMKRPDKNRVILHRFKIKCPVCDNKFEETIKKLTKYLLKFYGLT